MKNDYNLRKELKKLSAIRGSGTELISIYVPPGFPVSEEVAKLRNEYSQSSNIKSKSTKQNVMGAIDKIMQYLKQYREVPNVGLAIFCGNISDDPSKTDIELFSVVPTMPIKVNIYRCDSTFLLDPLLAIAEAKDIYAIVVMDGREATVAALKGTHVEVEKKIKSFAHAKVRKGGQSAARYERMTEEATNDYYKDVSASINGLFAKHSFKVKGLIVGGAGPAKEDFVKSGHLNYQVKVLGVFDTGYTDERAGISELLSKSKELLEQQEAIKERETMERFFNEIAHGKLAAYGYKRVKHALMNGNALKLIVSEEADMHVVKYQCSLCGKSFERVEAGNARETKHNAIEGEDGDPRCEGTLKVVETRDAVEELVDIAESHGIDTEFISTDSNQGEQLLIGFGGIGVMLRHRE
ncbi:MAG: peptide chain release factor aRF-1 [Candidatus Marsarchaeota archaeon]|nr:peptide chain release factor aRF-1 [Candidatus Marsarchaeota archaeon]